MTTVLLVIHILLALALIGVVLLQRSEGGGLGIGGGGGGGGGGMGGFLTGRGTANLLTRTTAILAAGFMLTSISLTILAGGGQPQSILDSLPSDAPAGTETAPAAPPPPTEPSVPTQ
ncbi:MAG: preprotein translocase subunit SecG [Kiloniellaceae bacterium]|nr:preprotein translocase subunit SecG [Kiloniellaceae bacterium]